MGRSSCSDLSIPGQTLTQRTNQGVPLEPAQRNVQKVLGEPTLLSHFEREGRRERARARERETNDKLRHASLLEDMPAPPLYN